MSLYFLKRKECKMKKKFETRKQRIKKAGIGIGFGLAVMICGTGCEANLDATVFVPAVKALVDTAKTGINRAVNEYFSYRFGENPVPFAIGSGLSATSNSLINHVIDETINEHFPE